MAELSKTESACRRIQKIHQIEILVFISTSFVAFSADLAVVLCEIFEKRHDLVVSLRIFAIKLEKQRIVDKNISDGDCGGRGEKKKKKKV